MEQELKDLRASVDRLTRAVFGDPDNPKSRPGIVHELIALQGEVERSNEILERIRSNLSKILWAVILAIVAAVLKLVLV